MPARPTLVPEPEAELLVALGERLRKARLRRKLTAEVVAAKAGMTRVTLHRAERGEPAITMGTFVKVMGVLGLAGDLERLAQDDRNRRLIRDEDLPRRRALTAARRPTRLGRVRIDRYPQLKQIAWHLGPGAAELEPEEAFALYERNWRHVDREAMDANERALLKELTDSIGKGVLLV